MVRGRDLVGGFSFVFAVGCGGTVSGDDGKSGAGAEGGGNTGGGGAVSSTGGAGSSGSSGTAGAPGGAGGIPPTTDAGSPPEPDPNAPPADGSAPVMLAVDRIFVGDTDWDGYPSAIAWQDFGFNVDGYASTRDSSYHCMPVEGANPGNVKGDGKDGIDNSFGANLLPLFLSLAPDFGASVNARIASGEGTLLIDLPNHGLLPSQRAVTANVYESGPSARPPSWDGNDTWPYYAAPTSVNNAYVVDGYLVSKAPSFDLTLSIQGIDLKLPIAYATIAARIVSGTAPLHAERGVISGILATDQVIEEFRRFVGYFDVSLCDGSTFASIAQQVRTASDILSNGTQDPSRECDAISIGIGFTAPRARLGELRARPTRPDPCSP